MKIQIIGVGMVGGTVARELLPYCDLMLLADENIFMAEGQMMDLERVVVQDNLKCHIFHSGEPIAKGMDWSVICLGTRYMGDEDMQLKENFEDVCRTIDKIDEGNILIVTNPAKRIYEAICLIAGAKSILGDFDTKRLTYAGDTVDKINNGREIHARKGYTNWGIGCEVRKMIGGEECGEKGICRKDKHA